MNIHELKSCLNGISIDLNQDHYDDALLLLNTVMCDAVRVGYKLAVTEFATWNNGEQLVGALEIPLREVIEMIDNSKVVIAESTFLELGD